MIHRLVVEFVELGFDCCFDCCVLLLIEMWEWMHGWPVIVACFNSIFCVFVLDVL